MPTDLELFTTQELIAEIMRRRTFMGVVVHSEDEVKSQPWEGKRNFKVHLNANLTAERACLLLDVITDHISRHEI